MDKSFAWNTLAQGLREAAGNRNWEAVSRLDGRIADLLRSLGSHPAVSAAERMALDELRDAHQAAAAACAREIDVVGQQLDAMRSRHDGWRAYAVNGDLEELNP